MTRFEPKIITKKWRVDSDVLQKEEPLLLHPEMDQPEEHFVFHSDGKIAEKNYSERGKASIEILSLNRDELVFARKQKIERYRTIWKRLISTIENKLKKGEITRKTDFRTKVEDLFQSHFEELQKESLKDQEFSRLGWHMFRQFESFFLEDKNLKGLHREILQEAFLHLRNHIAD